MGFPCCYSLAKRLKLMSVIEVSAYRTIPVLVGPYLQIEFFWLPENPLCNTHSEFRKSLPLAQSTCKGRQSHSISQMN